MVESKKKLMPEASKAISAFLNVFSVVCVRNGIDQAFLSAYEPEMDRMLSLEETLNESDRRILRSLDRAFRKALKFHGPRLN